MTTTLAITTGVLILIVIWLAIERRIDRKVNNTLARNLEAEYDHTDRIRLDRDRLLKQVARLSDELHAVPNLPDPVAYMRDLVERFRRIGGGL